VTYSEEVIAAAKQILLPWEGLGPFSFPKTEPGVRLLAITLLDLTGGDFARAAEFSALVGRVCPQCPNPLVMRKVYCQHWKPADGIEDSDLDYERFFGGGGKKREE
jgi:hypothetical protein